MRFAPVFVLLALFLATTGCTAPGGPDEAPVLQVTGIPDLTGTWTGPMEGYDEGTGFSRYPDLAVAMVITEQQGRLFAGNFTFRTNGSGTRSGFAGAIGRDNRTLTLAEENGGYCTGTILGGDDIELVYMEDGSPYSIAIDSFRRVSG